VSKIAGLFASAHQGLVENETLEFGCFPNFVAQKINMETGVNIKGAKRLITTSGISHAFKQHGNDQLEKQRGQKGLTVSDFELIPTIVANYDRVEKGHENRGCKGLLFIKHINGVDYYVAMKLRTNGGDSKLEFATMYAKYKKSQCINTPASNKLL
jgi:hypothetical protein